jgi:proliferating cell nuclear antigen PCNA
MKVLIKQKNKKELFIALFQTIKNCSSLINLEFKKEELFIQGMDKSHVCMFEVKIISSWFDSYTTNENENKKFLVLDSQIFSTILSVMNDHYSLELYQEEDDFLNIDLITMDGVKGEINKMFKIPLNDCDYELLHLPNIEYDADFSIYSKKICEITGQMLVFGNDIQIQCTEDYVQLITNGVSGEMIVKIPMDDLKEYSINEDEQIDLKYSLTYIHKMCLTSRLSNSVIFSLSMEYPMKIYYDLGENCSLTFYIAPKIAD